jgi:hypothetical protein
MAVVARLDALAHPVAQVAVYLARLRVAKRLLPLAEGKKGLVRYCRP